MKKIFVALMFLLLSVSLFATEFMDPDAIRPGMKGYGLSVFHGWEPQRFDVKIIDVMKNTFPAGDMILARLSGAGLEKSGVIAGMSGSPVYIDGKLIGAVAYTWSFSKEPLAGITPIRQMLEEKKNADSAFFDDHSHFKRISTPLMVSGIYGKARDFLAASLSNKGFVISEGGAGSSLKSPSHTLKPGDSVALNLVDGDLNLAGIGTVTYVDGKDVYIFGHPMSQTGNLSLPISRSYIYGVIPSQMLSYKMGASSQPLGASLFDGQSAVYFRLGQPAGMVPVTVKIQTWKNKATYHYRVAGHKDYFSAMLATTLSSSLLSMAGKMDEKNIDLSFRINLEYKGKKYVITNSFNYSFVPSVFDLWTMMSDLNSFLSMVQNPSFGDIRVTKADFKIEVHKGVSYYTIQSVHADKRAFKAGENLQVSVTAKNYKGTRKKWSVNLKLPSFLPAGQYQLIVGNDYSVDYNNWKYFPYLHRVYNIDSLMREANKSRSNQTLDVMLLGFDKGIMYEDTALPSFPENYIIALNLKNKAGKFDRFPRIIEQRRNLDKPLFGERTMAIKVLKIKSKKVNQ